MESEIKSPEDAPAEKLPLKRKSGSRRRSIIIFTLVSLLNAGLLVLLWSQLLTPAANSNKASASDPLIGKPAPDFTLAALSQHAAPVVHLASFKGKPVVINFWASWCDPCKQEAPLLQAEWQRVRGVIFIGVDFQDRQSAGLSFLQQNGITYLNATDSNGATAINYGVTGVPETFFIDRRGIIISTVRKQLTAQVLQSEVDLLTR